MADRENVTELFVNTKGLSSAAKTATATLKGLDKVLVRVADGVADAFSVKGFEDYKDTVTRFGKELADALLVLQLRFGRMRYAIAEAVAPLASVFVPMLNSAMSAVIRFADVVGQFLRGLIAGITGNKSLADSAREAIHTEEELTSAAGAAGKAVRRSLAGFDQLQRLNGPTGSGGGGGGDPDLDIWGGFTQDPISPEIQAMVDKILALLAPLMAIDLHPLKTALQGLGDAFSRFAAVAGEGLSFLWYEILTPFAAWVTESLAPALVDLLAAGLDLVTAALSPLVEGIGVLWEALKPIVEYIGDAVVAALDKWKDRFGKLTEVFREKSPVIKGIFENIAQIISAMWNAVKPVLTALGDYFDQVFDGVSDTAGKVIGNVLDMLLGLTTFLSGVFTGNWKKAWEGVKLFLKSAVNAVINLLNGMISRLVDALNAVVRAANKLSFTVPAWVPLVGGRHFGVNLTPVSAPQIPQLAAGAVLPAGKPFLAMVGDQHHGTNVEAPLATIQEAVALVMEEQTAAILQGFEASVGVQREILEAVLGIHVGDEVIGQAVNRYQRKMALMRGG